MSIHTYAMMEIARQRHLEIAEQLGACRPRRVSTVAPRHATPRRVAARVAYLLTALVTAAVVLVMATSATPVHAATARPATTGISSTGQTSTQVQALAPRRHT
jgi:hypothetical protein